VVEEGIALTPPLVYTELDEKREAITGRGALKSGGVGESNVPSSDERPLLKEGEGDSSRARRIVSVSCSLFSLSPPQKKP